MKAIQSLTLGIGLLGVPCYAHDPSEPVPPRQFVVVPPGAGSLSYPGEWKLTKDQHGAGFSLVEIKTATVRDDWRGPRHVHTREDEAWYVIEGELAFEVGDNKATAGPGTLVFAPRDLPHRYRVVKAPARYLLIFSPAGIEPLFGEVAALMTKLKEGSPEYRAELEKLQAKYGARTVHE